MVLEPFLLPAIIGSLFALPIISFIIGFPPNVRFSGSFRNSEHQGILNKTTLFAVKCVLIFTNQTFILTFVHFFHMFIITEQ